MKKYIKNIIINEIRNINKLLIGKLQIVTTVILIHLNCFLKTEDPGITEFEKMHTEDKLSNDNYNKTFDAKIYIK